jgi:TolB-like protein
LRDIGDARIEMEETAHEPVPSVSSINSTLPIAPVALSPGGSGKLAPPARSRRVSRRVLVGSLLFMLLVCSSLLPFVLFELGFIRMFRGASTTKATLPARINASGASGAISRVMPPQSVAVLPFSNTRDGQQESEELAALITKFMLRDPKLKVTSQSRVLAIPNIGRETPDRWGNNLGVRTVVASKLAKQGEKLVIEAELIAVDGGTLLWTEKYTQKNLVQYETEFKTLDELAAKIAKQVQIRLAGGSK